MSLIQSSRMQMRTNKLIGKVRSPAKDLSKTLNKSLVPHSRTQMIKDAFPENNEQGEDRIKNYQTLQNVEIQPNVGSYGDSILENAKSATLFGTRAKSNAKSNFKLIKNNVQSK